jgi:hypothetical protein
VVSLVRPARLCARRSLAALAGLTVLGCATVKNTPEQDLAYARWAACERPSALVALDRVEPDGRIWFSFFLESERQSMVTCLARAGSGGPGLPPPVGVHRGKGGA